MIPTPLDPALWNVLHDGYVDIIEGSLPGDVRLGIAIECLRKRFPDPGTLIRVTLHGCTKLEFHRVDDAGVIADLRELVDSSLEILSAEGPAEAFCVDFGGEGGTLSLAADGYSLSLDSGREIGLDELVAVARVYWDGFGQAAKS